MKTTYLKKIHYFFDTLGALLLITGFLILFQDSSQTYGTLEIILFIIGALLLGIGIISHILYRNRTAGIRVL
ncbi:hypothetical protein ACFLRN_07800 [Thermoproteota archaeon]